MPSSKVLRKGRWLWTCTQSNNASNWKDYECCGARSSGSFTTELEARQAGNRHGSKKGHKVSVWQIPKI